MTWKLLSQCITHAEVKIFPVELIFITSSLMSKLELSHSREQTGSDENGLDESFLSSPKVLIGDLKTIVGDSRFRGNDNFI